MTSDRLAPDLAGVAETLLIPLWARAAETRRPDGIVQDRPAVELVERLDYDFTALAGDRMAQLGVAIRTEILDGLAREHLAQHPAAAVINLAAGLDTRFHRLDNGQLAWWDVDLPESMRLRDQLLPPGDRRRHVAGSVLDPEWLEAIGPAGDHPLVIIEGLLMYLAPADVAGLMRTIATRFPGATVLLEAYGPAATANTWAFRSVARTTARFNWGLGDVTALEAMHPALRVSGQWSYLDRHAARWGLYAVGRFIPPWKTMFRIVRVEVAGAP